MTESILRYVKYVIGIVVLFVALWGFGNYGCGKFNGKEMEPTYERDSMKFISTSLRRADEMQAMDVIMYEYDQSAYKQKAFAGRVVGTPGDVVRMERGQVYVNGKPFPSEFVGQAYRSVDDLAPTIVPRDTVFVLADNRRDYKKFDSRGIGPIHYWSVVGTVD